MPRRQGDAAETCRSLGGSSGVPQRLGGAGRVGAARSARPFPGRSARRGRQRRRCPLRVNKDRVLRGQRRPPHCAACPHSHGAKPRGRTACVTRARPRPSDWGSSCCSAVGGLCGLAPRCSGAVSSFTGAARPKAAAPRGPGLLSPRTHAHSRRPWGRVGGEAGPGPQKRLWVPVGREPAQTHCSPF